MHYTSGILEVSSVFGASASGNSHWIGVYVRCSLGCSEVSIQPCLRVRLLRKRLLKEPSAEKPSVQQDMSHIEDHPYYVQLL